LEYKEQVNEIVINFIYDEGYDETIIEKELEKLIKEQIENVNEIDVFFSSFEDGMRIQIILKINKIYDHIKCVYLFDPEILINNKRKYRLKKILE
jgi:glycerophosphoryl diester phosphodiesterase